MTQHTPGPWTLLPDKHGWTLTANGAEITAAPFDTEDENARLMGAAPELSDALHALLDWGREHTRPRDPNSPHLLLIAAAAALRKAGTTEEPVTPQVTAYVKLLDAAPAMLAALYKADERISDLCRMVCTLAGNPKKVRAEDYADQIRAAIAKATA